jgi:di/tricarboxylate transporter
MTTDQMLILGILLATVAMFLWGRWRHDMVAVGALLACVVARLVPAADAFYGFGHPAVITVACVLILSRGLQNSGAVDALARRVLPENAGPLISILSLTGLGALLSAFMNNVGALALLMPIAVKTAARQNLPPGRILMPLAFGTIIGGMITLIGTPPNLIVSGFRAQTGAGTFAMFDFAPIGLAVTLAGIAFIALIGWRLVPVRRQAGVEGFETGAYITEARVSEKSKIAGKSLREIDQILDETGAQILGMLRNEVRLNAPSPQRIVRPGDILVIEAEAEELASALSICGLQLEEAAQNTTQKNDSTDEQDVTAPDQDAPPEETEDDEEKKSGAADEIILMEMTILPQSVLAGRSARDIQLRTRYGINLLAVSRQGRRSMARLRSFSLKPGDLLLLQGPSETLAEFASNSGCVPLAEREVRIPDTRKALIACYIMAAAVGGAAFGLLPAAVSFAVGVLASLALRTVPPRTAYESIDWPVIVLLAALIPVAGAMESTGTADLIARFLIDSVAQGNIVFALTLIIVVTMMLSALVNNAATAATMCPIAIGTATALGVHADSFLMAVAIGASCAFVTPIAHQNNTLILGPGGFRFGDYWSLGLPLSILVVMVSVPLLLLIWPL